MCLRNSYKCFVRTPNEKRSLGIQGVGGTMIIKRILKEHNWKVWSGVLLLLRIQPNFGFFGKKGVMIY
jgi:hypothetical protein